MSQAVAAARELDVTTPDGRTLHAYEAGDRSGELVLVHHGTPCSGLLAGQWAESAARLGIRLVGFDRAGYGGSARRAGRSVADAASDTAALADALGVERFRSWGVSGGGPHVLACAALLPERVIAAACLAGVAPYDAPGLEWLAGMGQDNLDEFGAAADGEPALRAYLAGQREGLLGSTPDTIQVAMQSLLPPADLAVFNGERAQFLHAWMTSGLQDGYDGWLDDDLAFTKPWGFDLDSISVPVLVVQGEQDLMVPYAHGRWLAGHVPGAVSRLSPDDGHLSLLSHIDATHTWLLAQD
jgi:pimeloyl-ACP methyl ester carboxylesterase